MFRKGCGSGNWNSRMIGPALLAALPVLVTVRAYAAPDRQKEVREKLEGILNSDEFASADAPPSFLKYLADAIKRFYDWFSDWLKSRFQGLQLPEDASVLDRQLSPEAAQTLKLIGVTIVVLLVLLLLFFLGRNLRLSRRWKEQEDELLLTSLKQPSAMEETALEHARKGDYKQALRFLYIAMLLRFNERDWIRIDKAKTNRQYVTEIMNSSFTRKQEVRDFTEAFNRYWYGNRSLDRDAFEGWHKKYSLLMEGGET